VTLDQILEQAADKLVASTPTSQNLIDRIYHQALGRPPSAAEQALASNLVGQPAKSGGLQDFLWAMAMLPEFQLIY
jgi:hypothetical protein